MVALVLVSHSRKLALAVRELVLQMASPELRVGIAAGVGDDHEQVGTDAVHIADVIRELRGPDGAVVLMDLGSAVLSAQTALELLEDQKGVHLSSAPFLEGAIAAGVQASAGASLDAVVREAAAALTPKQEQIGTSVAEPRQLEQPQAAASSEWKQVVFTIRNEHGLHARPAALLVQTANRFPSDIEITNDTLIRGPAPAKSLTSIALLQIRKRDRVTVRAKGAGAEDALTAIQELAHAGFGEPPSQQSQQPLPSAPQARILKPNHGIAGSDGIAIGHVVAWNRAQAIDNSEPVGDPHAEFARLEDALSSVQTRLDDELKGSGLSGEIADILKAQALMMSDPVLREKLKRAIFEEHASAAASWNDACNEIAESYKAMDDPYLRERASDISDIAQRVLQELSGRSRVGVRLKEPAIVYARELLPADAASCDPAVDLGVITREGSPTSHSSIILRTLGIPAVLGVDWLQESELVGKQVALDGSTGEIRVEPEQDELADFRARQQEQRERQDAALRARSQPAETIDGVRIQVLANAATSEEAMLAAQNCADGIGLLRTEFLFLDRADLPSESQQVEALRQIVSATSGPTVIRTLDVGGDKPLAILPTEREANPFLGVRGIRLTLRFPDFFLAHLRAILQAGTGRDLWLMFPMVSGVDEVAKARELVEQAHRELEAERIPHAWPIRLGCMIEVPGAALIAAQIAREVDFFSIGTNDLTQYTLAAERGSHALSSLQDALHPSVLQLIRSVIEGASLYNRHVCICGDAASDPVAAAAFVAIGIRCLSVRPRQVPDIKAAVRTLHTDELTRFAADLLACADAAAVRRRIKAFSEERTVAGNQ